MQSRDARFEVPGQAFDRPQYRHYDRSRALHPDAERSFGELVAGLAAPRARLLDVGAGTGRFQNAFTSRGLRYIGIEPSNTMLDQVSDQSQSVRAVAEHLPFPAASFDLCVMSMVLHHVELAAVSAEIERVLSTNGHAVIRNHFAGRLDGVPVYEWFPAARRADEQRLPSVSRVVEAFGWGHPTIVTLEHRFADSVTALRERMAQRSESVFELITTEEHAEGLDALEAAIVSGRGDGPVMTHNDVLIITR